MHMLRVACTSDFPVIYNMQNTPLREQFLTDPLPSYETFLIQTESRFQQGTEYYFVHDADGKATGFIHYLKSEAGWHPLIWGRWLNTLVYAAARTAFEHLRFPKLNWYARHTNQRAIRCYERFQFRKTGEAQVCNITAGFGFIAIGHVNFYELTADEFHVKEEWMKKDSLPLVFQW